MFSVDTSTAKKTHLYCTAHCGLQDQLGTQLSDFETDCWWVSEGEERQTRGVHFWGEVPVRRPDSPLSRVHHTPNRQLGNYDRCEPWGSKYDLNCRGCVNRFSEKGLQWSLSSRENRELLLQKAIWVSEWGNSSAVVECTLSTLRPWAYPGIPMKGGTEGGRQGGRVGSKLE